MRYEMMFPYQIREAIDKHWPVVLPIGVLEYHAEHLVVGTDTLVVNRIIELLEKEIDLVILPPFYYGAASYAVESPERKGTIHVDSGVLNQFAKQLFTGLLRVGFRNIHCFITHQTENFINGMPTDLSFKLAARQSIFDYVEKERGEGWWGDSSMKDYYEKNLKQTSVFNWIKVHPLKGDDVDLEQKGDHAGFLETSMMLSLCKEGVNMNKFTKEKWYCVEATKANTEYGDVVKEKILESLRRILK